jgi:hypothetical protein
MRFCTPSFWMATERWLRTVPSERPSRVAMAATVVPSTDAASTSRSRRVSGFHGASQVADSSEGRQHQHSATGQRLAQCCRGLEPALTRQLDIQERHLRPYLERDAHDVVAASDLGLDVDVALQSQQRRDGPPHQRLIFREQDTNHDVRSRGFTSLTLASTNTRKPPSARGPASRRPPDAAARSERPDNPRASGAPAHS